MVIRTISILTLLLASVVNAVIHDIIVGTVDKVTRWCHTAKATQSLLHCRGQSTRPSHVLSEQIGIRLHIVKFTVVLDNGTRPLPSTRVPG